jgi:hypothetical protein
MDKNYSLEELNKFLDWAQDKGVLKPETAKSRKVAANKILNKLSADEASDLRKIDLDREVDRFANRQGSDYLPASLQVYKSRLKSAVAEFIAYVDNPMGYKAGKSSKVTPINKSKSKPIERAPTPPDPLKVEPAHPRAHEESLAFPIPIRPGVIVKLTNIPVDLTKEEAEKIAQVVKALANISV